MSRMTFSTSLAVMTKDHTDHQAPASSRRVLPKCWVVERSFAWLEKYHRLWKNCEGKLNTSLQMVVLSFAVLILKRL